MLYEVITIVTSIIYMVVTLVMTGLVPWQQHGNADPLASAFSVV